MVCAYNYDYNSASFKTDAIIVVTHSQTVKLSIVNRELVIFEQHAWFVNNAFKKVWENDCVRFHRVCP